MHPLIVEQNIFTDIMDMISGAKVQKTIHACMIRLLNLGPAEHEEVVIYTVNQRIPNVRELREQLRCEAIRGYQVRGKIPFDPNIMNIITLLKLSCHIMFHVKHRKCNFILSYYCLFLYFL